MGRRRRQPQILKGRANGSARINKRPQNAPSWAAPLAHVKPLGRLQDAVRVALVTVHATAQLTTFFNLTTCERQTLLFSATTLPRPRLKPAVAQLNSSHVLPALFLFSVSRRDSKHARSPYSSCISISGNLELSRRPNSRENGSRAKPNTDLASSFKFPNHCIRRDQ